jgi:hypothetical protein
LAGESCVGDGTLRDGSARRLRWSGRSGWITSAADAARKVDLGGGGRSRDG